LWVRAGVGETPRFRALEQHAERVRAPLGEVLRKHWRALLVAGGARVGPDVLYSLVAVFTLTYVTTILGLSRTLAVTALSIGAACNAVLIVAAGILSDRYGRRVVYGAGVAAGLVWVFVLFPLLDSKATFAIIMAVVSGLAIHAFMYGPQAAFIAEQFPTRVRYAGASLAYTFAGVFAGGIAPLMFTTLYRAFGTPLVVALYTAAALLITGIVLLIARERAGTALD
jgi:MFS family permease